MDDKILSQTRLISEEKVEKLKSEFYKQTDIVTGSSVHDLFDKLDEYHLAR